MRVEIVNESSGQEPVATFPPAKGYLDLKTNPRSIEQIEAVRAHLPLRNFLNAVNSRESVFATSSASTESKASSIAGAVEPWEFGSRVRLVFAVALLNFDRSQFEELCASLKELLERDAADAVRAVLNVSPCDFAEQNRHGFSLEIELVARGDSAKQAELRWGLGLARVQQALLFRARALGQQIGARDCDDSLISGNE